MTEQHSTGLMADFDRLYQGDGDNFAGSGIRLDAIPWQLDGPQPLVAELVDSGQFTGPVLECGCGLGDNALLLAERGYQITAFDASPTVIEKDRAKASARGLTVDFRVANATVLDGIPGGFNTVLDSAMLHCLTPEQRSDYLAAVHRVTAPGARLHILCFVETLAINAVMPGHTDEASLRQVLSEHWQVERMDVARYTTGLTREQWNALGAAFQVAFPVDFDGDDAVDAQGRILLPIWQITATRG